MAKRKIFLSGSMTGLSKEEATKWRNEFKDYALYEDLYVDIVSPPDYYLPNGIEKDEREAMKFELYHLRTSDVVVINFDTNPNSIGSAMEIMLANELHIPVVGISEDPSKLHPWLKECCMVICCDVVDACDYVSDYLIISY